MLQQYHELKRQHPGALLFFRLGDFYELFFDDAVAAARDSEITLTARHKDSPNPVPMCGVPHHSASVHIARLIRKGHRVAICEQVEETAPGKKLVRREVVRVITPGTAVDPQLVEATQPAYLAALCSSGGTNPNFGIAFLDFSTGEFRATQSSGENALLEIVSHVSSFAPREILFPASLAPLINNLFPTDAPSADIHQADNTDDTALATPDATTKTGATAHPIVASINASPLQNQTRDARFARTSLDDWLWQLKDAESLLCSHFRVQTLDGFRLTDKPEAIRAAAACLRYAQETQRLDTRHIADLKTFEAHDHLVLDHVTLRNLEVVESQSERGSTRRTLLGVLDATVTGMGARMLRAWVLRPLVQLDEINKRLCAVEELFHSQIKRDELRTLLKGVVDLERLTARLSMNTASPRDISTLRRSLESLPKLITILPDSQAHYLLSLAMDLDGLADVLEEITRTLADDPPINITDGGVIRTGVHAELDDLRAISSDAKATIAALENRERTRSGISTLRIRYNNVFGYYIEVGRAQAARVPTDYERRQTLANAERFTTPELKQYETRLLGADERIAELETSLFAELRASIAAHTNRPANDFPRFGYARCARGSSRNSRTQTLR
jgi:DNA mismatch repair protein MutS